MPPHQQPGDQQVKRDTFARLAAEADEMEALIASVICRHQTIGPSLDPNPLQYPRRFLAPRPECAADVGSPLRQGSSLPLTLNFPYALPPHGFRIRLTGRVPERIRGGGCNAAYLVRVQAGHPCCEVPQRGDGRSSASRGYRGRG